MCSYSSLSELITTTVAAGLTLLMALKTFLFKVVRKGRKMTYTDRLGKILVGTLDGGVPLGVDVEGSSSVVDNRGRLIGSSAQMYLPNTFSTHLDFGLLFSFIGGGES